MSAESPRDRDPIAALGTPVPAPDLTGSIMGRLGYMRAAPAVVRRRRRRARVARATMIVAAFALTVTAYTIHEHGPDARRPGVGTSVPDAIDRDVEQRQRRWTNTIRFLRQRGPTDTAPSSSTPAPDRDDPYEGFDALERSAVAFKWT